MQSSDVGVPNECFRIAAKEFGIEIGKDPHRAVTAGAANHGLYIWVFPDGHEILCPFFVLVLLEAAKPLDLGLEDHSVSGFFDCLDAAAKPAAIRSVGWADHANRISLQQGRRSQQRWRGYRRDERDRR